jgi:lysyl-tRNA synthetase class 2
VSWSPTTTPEVRALRARLNRGIREFFHHRDVLEVETPLISASGNTDPQIESVACSVGDGLRHLRTSPEFPMKRLLAAGSGPIYELGRVFRAGENGRNHNAEFTLLEWYRPGYSLDDLIAEVVALVVEGSAAEGLRLNVQRYRYRELLSRHLAIDPITVSDAGLLELVHQRGWYTGALDRSACLDLILSFGVAPTFDPMQLTVISGFPACQSALARMSDEEPGTALRFEVFIGNLELANGYDELYDAVELRQRLEGENRRRREQGQVAMELDEHLLQALGMGVEPGCGVALGVDRWLMKLAGSAGIDEVINFPQGIA